MHISKIFQEDHSEEDLSFVFYKIIMYKLRIYSNNEFLGNVILFHGQNPRENRGLSQVTRRDTTDYTLGYNLLKNVFDKIIKGFIDIAWVCFAQLEINKIIIDYVGRSTLVAEVGRNMESQSATTKGSERYRIVARRLFGRAIRVSHPRVLSRSHFRAHEKEKLALRAPVVSSYVNTRPAM